MERVHAKINALQPKSPLGNHLGSQPFLLVYIYLHTVYTKLTLTPYNEHIKTQRIHKVRSTITFETIDTNGDGGISPEEFKNFRAKKNGIDPAKFKHDLYFKRIDTNGDGKMDRDEFRKMREAKAGKS
jgi:hypothetical protein